MKHYEILVSLTELASADGNNKYNITDFAFGFIPFKNGENKTEEVGNDFFNIARWLINEAEENLKN